MTNQRPVRRPISTEINTAMRRHLETGNNFWLVLSGCPIRSEAARLAWEEHGEQITADWIKTHPGSRPAAWWLFEATERRQRVNGRHPFDDPTHPDRSRKLSFGVPSARYCQDDWSARYETESEFLIRLNLLLPGESEALSKEPAHVQ